MPTLKITRSDEYANRMRNILISLDGKDLGRLSHAETKDFEIAAGMHHLRAKIDWCGSNKITFTIAENETAHFYVDSFAKHNPLGIFAGIFYITFGAGRYLHMERKNT